MRAGTVLAGAVVLLARGGSAWALCPNCLGQSPSVPPAVKLIGMFLLIPPAIFFAVAIAVRKLARQSPGADRRDA